jgi:hypothetical protein
MQDEVGGSKQVEGMRKEGLGRKVHLTGRNRQEDAGGSRRRETNKKQAGGRQETGRRQAGGSRRHKTGKIRKKGAFDRQD